MYELREDIRQHAISIGFNAVGFTSASTEIKSQTALEKFIEQGHHGNMIWMSKSISQRSSPSILWPEVRSIISLGMNYGPGDNPLAIHSQRTRGAISVYAQGSDYHDVLKKRLKKLARWLVELTECKVKVFVDTAPVMEKPLAARAGLGWQGKHTNLVSRKFGSWLFLGEIYSTLELPPDSPEIDHCGSCDACRRACPTGALDNEYQIDSRKCISYLTIEYKGHIDSNFADQMGNRIYGCDDCLAVCPWNKFSIPSKEDAFAARVSTSKPYLKELLKLDDSEFRKKFSGSPIKRTGRDRIVRNALVAAGNSGDTSLRPYILPLLSDISNLVRHAAEWANKKLLQSESRPNT